MPNKPLNLSTIRLAADDITRLDAIASIEDVSRSHVIRRAIKKYINEYKRNSTDENKSRDSANNS